MLLFYFQHCSEIPDPNMKYNYNPSSTKKKRKTLVDGLYMSRKPKNELKILY